MSEKSSFDPAKFEAGKLQNQYPDLGPKAPETGKDAARNVKPGLQEKSGTEKEASRDAGNIDMTGRENAPEFLKEGGQNAPRKIK